MKFWKIIFFTSLIYFTSRAAFAETDASPTYNFYFNHSKNSAPVGDQKVDNSIKPVPAAEEKTEAIKSEKPTPEKPERRSDAFSTIYEYERANMYDFKSSMKNYSFAGGMSKFGVGLHLSDSLTLLGFYHHRSDDNTAGFSENKQSGFSLGLARKSRLFFLDIEQRIEFAQITSSYKSQMFTGTEDFGFAQPIEFKNRTKSVRLSMGPTFELGKLTLGAGGSVGHFNTEGFKYTMLGLYANIAARF